ncbi:SOS response-associated peptidase family protein [Lysobacter sp. H21R4]|uniref:SOS response-associated peptidase family protein n=1 Tax=Lysobacter sp. H21R4 TaxID=2781021 RepID=UPI00188730C4|nr:SOS response-associated peptidase family protein [Lysobacter sp. H21R4]QOY62053.1 SOS response-associated peptidase family protein [Lysobacter sp. H21R4]
MCFSAQVWADYERYTRRFDARMDINTFVRLYVDRKRGDRIKIPFAMDAAFARPTSPEEQQIHALIQQYNQDEATRLEQDLFKQVKRLNDAQRTLQTRTTKKATEDVRIATSRIAQIKGRLADLRRTALLPRDSRIFPGMVAPVMVWEDGARVVKPMRYQCRPAGKPAFYDRKFPGTYNARRDSLEGFWKAQFGHHHALMVADRFYENVDTPEGNQVLEFEPRTGEPMLVACLWSRWTDGDEELLSFAAITDEPEPEVAAAGHDRTIINIKPEHIDAWLNPDPQDLSALYAIFDDRQHPHYEHRKAA